MLISFSSRTLALAHTDKTTSKWFADHNCHELGLLLCLSLTHSVVHTCSQTHTPALSPTCLSSQSALALLCSDTCSHSHLIIPSIYSGCACCPLSDYCVSCIGCSLSTCRNTLEISPCLVSPRVAVCFLFSWCPVATSSEPISTSSLKTAVPWTRQPTVLFCFFIQFCVYVRQTALFCIFIKDCLYYSCCTWILYTSPDRTIQPDLMDPAKEEPEAILGWVDIRG